MKKMMMLGFMAVAATSAYANCPASAKAEAQQVAGCADEQAFVTKLSPVNKEKFDHMTAEQKQAAIAAAKDATTADAAVEKVAAEKK